MGVKKFYAYYKKSDEEYKIVDAFEALKLRDVTKEIVTQPKEKGKLYDIDTFLKVCPVKGKNGEGLPHFSYYNGEDSPLKGRESTMQYSMELNSYIKAFEEIDSFKIKEKFKEPITIVPRFMHKFKRIETNNSFVIVKFLVELEETKPYSAFYKFNGVLALEFSVTSQPKPVKRKELELQGIPLFTSQLEFPAWMSISEEEPTEKEFVEIVEELKNTYQNKNYYLLGKFDNQSINFPEYKEKYIILNNFERQCEELENKKKELETIIKNQKNILDAIKAEKKSQEIEIHNNKRLLEVLRKEVDSYPKIKEANARLTETNAQQREEIEQLKATLYPVEREKEKPNLQSNKQITNKKPILHLENIPKKKEGWLSKLKNLKK